MTPPLNMGKAYKGEFYKENDKIALMKSIKASL